MERKRIREKKNCIWKKAGLWRFAAAVLGIAALAALAVAGSLFYPYMDLPHVTAEDLDALQLEGYDKVMFVAHPDDELLWGGQHLLEGDYLVVCLTGGNDQVRRAEFEAVLKATNDKGLILSYPDKIGGKRSSWKLWRKDIEADIATVLQYKEWQAAASHNEEGEYGHQQHIMTHESVKREYGKIGCKAALYWFGRYYVDDKVPYDLEEMDKSVYNEKRKIAKLYESQRPSIRKLYHMLPYEYWTQEAAGP